MARIHKVKSLLHTKIHDAASLVCLLHFFQFPLPLSLLPTGVRTLRCRLAYRVAQSAPRSRSMRARLVLLGIISLSLPAIAAYSQIKECSGHPGGGGSTPDRPRFRLQSLRASLDVQQHGNSQLELTIFTTHPGWKTCGDVQQGRYVSTVQMATLGRAPEYEAESTTKPGCEQWESHLPEVSHTFVYQIDDPRPLDSYFLTVNLQGEEESLSGCVNSPLTPDIGSIITGIATWAPILVFTSVVVVAFLHKTTSLLVEEDRETHAPHGRAQITQIADCISYLQFIFFSAALSLSYPGFLQPVASRTSWSTLMLRNGVVVRDPWYDGVRDGIYAINGTFGGTYGMELMTQVMGGTITTDTWLNTLVLAALILVLLGGVMLSGEKLRWTKDWFQASYSLEFRDGDRVGVKATLWRILRVFCSYFLLPLVAWTTYQLDLAQWQPIYHTVAAAAVICGTLLLIWWAMSQSSPRSLGYLLVSASAGQEDLPGSIRVQNIHAAGFFLLLILRGIAIGGLQMAGMAQLLVLIVLELVQIALQVAVYRISSTWSRTELMPIIRLTVLALQMAFLPGICELATKMVVGYLILAIHGLVLTSLFFLPAILEVASLTHASLTTQISTLWPEPDEDQQPQVYGLRQLVRRPTNRRAQGASDTSSSSASPSPLPISPRSDQRLSGRDSAYFRHPHSSLSLHTLPPRNSSARGTLTENTISESSTTSNEEVPADSSVAVDKPLPTPSPNPNVDYSFREADLYYVQPRRLSFHDESGASGSNLRDRMLSWVRWPG